MQRKSGLSRSLLGTITLQTYETMISNFLVAMVNFRSHGAYFRRNAEPRYCSKLYKIDFSKCYLHNSQCVLCNNDLNVEKAFLNILTFHLVHNYLTS